MGHLSISEMKYSLKSRLSDSSPSIKHLLFKFNEETADIAKKHKTEIIAKTHIRGLSYFITPKRAFLFLNIRNEFLSLVFYTGKDKISGLAKGNWNDGGDNCGSKTFRIENDKSLSEALKFADRSFEIAFKDFGKQV